MININKIRNIDKVNTSHLDDKELEILYESFYDLGQLIFDDWYEQRFGSKFPVGSLTTNKEEHTI